MANYLKVLSDYIIGELNNYKSGSDEDKQKALRIEDAIDKAMADPEYDKWKRPYLTPYRQVHDSTKRFTVYFKIEEIKPLKDSKAVFFVFVNSPDELHDTRRYGEDPSLVEFTKYKDSGNLEPFVPEYYLGNYRSRFQSTYAQFLYKLRNNSSQAQAILNQDDNNPNLWTCSGGAFLSVGDSELGQSAQLLLKIVEEFRGRGCNLTIDVYNYDDDDKKKLHDEVLTELGLRKIIFEDFIRYEL
ncbi:MAG: hypothetical protein A2X86_08090 [Bdellovibrionales bacterium GWA2_49_15]|nr:MAG: hypothetical protein A2X86_08090 [Bdellovibrionales bacterium GWA2_49_15]HAZ13270.1 hypothetical protein [Bdellovibrionales bacterium]